MAANKLARKRSLASIQRSSDLVSARSLARVAKQLGETRTISRTPHGEIVVRGPQLVERGRESRRADDIAPDNHLAPRSDLRAGDGALDLVGTPQPVTLELVSGRGHYERVIAAVRAARTSVWIATANVKELLVEDTRAAPGRRRTMKRAAYVSILAILDQLAEAGVELRLLHAELPSGPFREELANHPRLVGGALELRRCPRVHLKTVIVDGALMYLGSANWTGAGLGAKGSGRRNFEVGIVTDDGPLLDQVQGMYEQIWSGAECSGCKLRDQCPGPLDSYDATS